MPEPLKFGNMKLYFLDDGTYKRDGGPMFPFFPKKTWSNYKVFDQLPYKTDENNDITMVSKCFLIVHPEATILVETGTHDKTTDPRLNYHSVTKNSSLLSSLKEIRVSPDDIDFVVNSHLHADHIGWNTFYKDGKLLPTFKNAKYLIQKKEFEKAKSPGRAFQNDYLTFDLDVVPLEKFGNLELIIGDKEIVSEVFLTPTPGHTEGHQSLIMRTESRIPSSNEESENYDIKKVSMFYAGDVAPLVFHQEKPNCPSPFYIDRQQAWESKEKLLYGMKSSDIRYTIFYHEVATSLGILRETRDAEGNSPKHRVIRPDIK